MWPVGIFGLVANVEAVKRAVPLHLKRRIVFHVDTTNAGAIGDIPRIGIGALKRSDCAAPGRAVFERVLGQRPPDGAVAQRNDLVGDAGVDQRLRADDRAGAAGAVHDNGRLAIRRGLAGAQDQLGAGHADRARNVHGCVFVETPDVEDGNVGAGRYQRGDVVGRQRRRVSAGLDQFTKGFCVGIDVLKEFVACVLPGLQPAAERANVAVAQRRQRLARGGHEAFASIVEDNRHILARQPCLGFERDPVRRHVRGEQGVAGGKGRLMSEVKKRDLFAQQQRAADLRRCHERWLHEWFGTIDVAWGQIIAFYGRERN